MTELDPRIQALADVAGVATSWVDAWGAPQRVAHDDLVAVLEALTNRDLGGWDDVAAMHRSIESDRPFLPPVVVAWDGRLSPIRLAGPAVSAVLALEDGRETPARVSEGVVTVPDLLPIGYHRLVIDDGSHSAHVFSAPLKAHPAPRGVLGVIAPTYSLRRSGHDTGIGAIPELALLADLCLRGDVKVVGTLPLLAAFPDQPSPYAPASRRAWNEIFVDLDHLPGWAPPPVIAESTDLLVDYDVVGASIRARLADYAAFVERTPRLRSEVEEFLSRDPEMARYAAFRALTDAHGRNWRAWSVDVVGDPGRVAYHETVQWLMDRQLRALSRTLTDRGQYLYLDLPIGCHPDGYDIWDHPDLFAPASLGAPPDTLFAGGQDWGLPASIPIRSRLEGHANFRKAIQRQLSVAGLLRIDHVMGIHRTWWVPHGRGATHGAYVMQPVEEFFAIICIESSRAHAGVVGENLGTVPPEIRRGLGDHELLGMAIAQDGVSEPKSTDLVALSSHDTPAFAAWWEGSDIDDLADLGVFDEDRVELERRRRAAMITDLQRRFGTHGPEATRDALMLWMSGTDAAVALINLDDLLMEERRQNVPGTDWERPNWRLRHRVSLDDLTVDPEFVATLRRFARERSV